jgi:ubiquinone/menaquinone biosynthesis C-methylase UbiE
MTWEEIIISARNNPAYQEVIRQSYLEEDLVQNVERFGKSEEFVETSKIFSEKGGQAGLKLLDIGSGNGISAISFSLLGYDVTVVEPDKSDTVGSGAIQKLAGHYNLSLNIINGVGEQLTLPDNCFDIIYARQTLHHASDLNKFLKECYRVIKQGGIILTVRDHVIYGEKDKEWFLGSHPFHRFYNGENAFRKDEYRKAFENAGFKIVRMMRHWDTVINYFPLSTKDYHEYPGKIELALNEKLIQRLGFTGKLSIVRGLFRWYKGFYPSWYNEKLIPGRLYSFLAVKK